MKCEKFSMQLWQAHIILKLLILTYRHMVMADISSVCAGNNTVLDCKHQPGDKLLMVTWKLHRLDRSHCYMSVIREENQTYNNCSNRMRLKLGGNRVSLRIDNSTISDEGNYTCEIVNQTGTYSSTVTLQVLAEPLVLITLSQSGSLECRAIGGNPAAGISWTSESYNDIKSRNYTEGNRTTTVISTYRPRDGNVTEATCVVSHPTFTDPVRRTITIPVVGEYNIWWVSAPILILVFAIVIIMSWQHTRLRPCLGMEKDNTEDVQENPNVIIEEVEPYASFTQKVNTIYNSTNELSDEKKWTSDNWTQKDYC
ncbi:cell surface glycoprotein CD200 receptor 1-like isoform X2 [Pseudophryne corroboree]|uniref:cell surface glycoprotein CD200 receptor 1-like isoform X2 n=1 Tax=Pseudophryne corroboree TaxID=495146 RepID=UPI0030821C4D